MISEPTGQEREAFLAKVKSSMQDVGPRSKVDRVWFQRRLRDDAGKSHTVAQATVFVQRNPEARLEFGDDSQVRRRSSRNVASAFVLLDLDRGELDVMMKGAAAQDTLAAAFVETTFRSDLAVERIKQRRIDLSAL